MIYTTEELINLLQGEFQAGNKGERLKLSAKSTGFSKEADAILSTEGIQQVESYHDFRAEIWKYQVQNLVSGLVWSEIDINGKLFQFPQIHDQLISLPNDVELMKSYKARAVDFWRGVAQGLDIWRAGSNKKGDERPGIVISLPVAELLINQAEWATLSANNFDRQLRRWTLDARPDYQEINIQLGWGWAELAGYLQHWPEHGSEWLTAVSPNAVEPEE